MHIRMVFPFDVVILVVYFFFHVKLSCTRIEGQHITIGIMSPFPLSALNRLSNTNAITFYGAHMLSKVPDIPVQTVVIRFFSTRSGNGEQTKGAKKGRERKAAGEIKRVVQKETNIKTHFILDDITLNFPQQKQLRKQHPH